MAFRSELVTTAEEPVDMTPPAIEEDDVAAAAADDVAADDAPAVSARAGRGPHRADRATTTSCQTATTEVAAVTTRKVRTMVVPPRRDAVPRGKDPGGAPAEGRP